MKPRTRLTSLPGLPLAALLILIMALVITGCREPHPLTRSYRSESHFLGIKRDRQGSQILPKGTKIHVRIKEPIAIGSTPAGGRFEGTLDRDLKRDGESIVPESTRVIGRLTKVLESASGKGFTEIGLVLEAIVLHGAEVKIKTETLTFQLPPADVALQRGIETSGFLYQPGTRLTFKLVKPLRVPTYPQTGWLPALSSPGRPRATG